MKRRNFIQFFWGLLGFGASVSVAGPPSQTADTANSSQALQLYKFSHLIFPPHLLPRYKECEFSMQWYKGEVENNLNIVLENYRREMNFSDAIPPEKQVEFELVSAEQCYRTDDGKRIRASHVWVRTNDAGLEALKQLIDPKWGDCWQALVRPIND